jgi:hypothetical protein
MYLFFVRQFNDIDHLTPIVWKMQEDGDPVRVYCLNPAYDIRSDYRLSFLRKRGVKITYIYDELLTPLGIWHRLLRLANRVCFYISNRFKSLDSGPFAFLAYRAHRRAYKTAKKIFNATKTRFYDRSWATALLKSSAPQALCFDHINPGRHVVEVLLDAAETLSIPTFALPHGVFIYTNKDVRTGTTEESRVDKFNRFDYIVTQNRLRRDVLVRAGVRPEKIHVLGSVRYSDEWMAQNKLILPRKMDARLRGSTRLRAVFMTTRFSYKIDVDRMLKTFDRLAAIDNLHLLIKPHTRSGEEAKIYDHLAVTSVSDLSSVELCEWADIVFVIGSSILIEPLKLNKPVLYLRYLHGNTTQYEEMGSCWIINDETELMKAMHTLLNDPTAVPYPTVAVDSFLAEIIYGGTKTKGVLDTYRSFIVNNTAK